MSYRHLQSLRRVRDLIAAGELGDVFAVDLVFHNAYGPDKSWCHRPALAGGGCVIDLGVHLVDALLWCLETSVATVHSQVLTGGRPSGPGEVEDYASAQLSLANGTIAHLACSWRLHAGQPAFIELRFFGTRGGAAVCNVGGSFYEFRADRFHGPEREMLTGPPDDWQGRAIVQWTRELRSSPGFDPRITAQIAVAEALDAIYRQGTRSASRSHA